MKCDNCGEDTTNTISEEFVETRFKKSFPFFERVVVTEMWCPRCKYYPLNGAVSPSKRKKYKIEDK